MNNEAIPTENFTHWLIKIRKALRDNNGIDVPCAECRACCTSGYYITIHPHEKKTLASVPREFLSDAPGAPPGSRRLEFNHKGQCPLLQQSMCIIYKTRPWTCRIYDCRLLTAAGLTESDDKTEINKQVKRWKFAFSDAIDYENFEAVKRAARFIVDHRNDFPWGYVSSRPVQQAVVAVKVFEIFKADSLETSEKSRESFIAAVVKALKEFDA